ncbi:cytochrome-c oxidase, cbb3-type subunit III [Halovulum sp. GXIMD14793]
MSDQKDIDEFSGVETTGHEWDGIKELNNPLPRWWLWSFYATIVFSLVYVVLYPAWPLISSATGGVLGWNSRTALAETMEQVEASKAGQIAAIREKSVEEILADPELRSFAIASGAAAFKINCVQCHGSGAQGSPGYPNLNDDSWIWGGTPEAIHYSIQNGIRFEQDEDTRISDMPAFGADDWITPQEIALVADHVLSFTNRAETSEEGADLYLENCSSCHGEQGEGMADLGAPQLNDALWLYGREREDIIAQIHKPVHGVMPAWEDRLGDVTVKELAVYVHSLGGGQ